MATSVSSSPSSSRDSIGLNGTLSTSLDLVDLEPIPFEFGKPSSLYLSTKENQMFPEASSSKTFLQSLSSVSNGTMFESDIVALKSPPTTAGILDEACNIVLGEESDDDPLLDLDTLEKDSFFLQEEATSNDLFQGPIASTSSWWTLRTDTSEDLSSLQQPRASTTISNMPLPRPRIKPSAVGRSWYERYQELTTFQNDFGHCCVPVHWPQNPQLAQWVKRQRSQYKMRKDGKYSNMSNERLQALQELNFVWDSHSALWDKRLLELAKFREQHGHCNVPTQYPPNQNLAVWAQSQRRQFKLYCQARDDDCNTKCHISAERIPKLLRVGFVFNPTCRDFLSNRNQKVKRKTPMTPLIDTAW